MKTQISFSRLTITGSLIKELMKQVGKTQPCTVLAARKMLWRNRNLQWPDSWRLSWLQSRRPSSANTMDHFQELSLQRAPSARQHIQNPAAEHRTHFSLISKSLVFITLKSGTATFITSLFGSGFTFFTVSHVRPLTDKSTHLPLYCLGLHIRNGSSQRP